MAMSAIYWVSSIIVVVCLLVILALGWRSKRRYGRFDFEAEEALLVLAFMALVVLPWAKWGRWVPSKFWLWWIANIALTIVCLIAVVCFLAALGVGQILPRQLRVSLTLGTVSLCLLTIGQWSGWHGLIQSILVGCVVGFASHFWRAYEGSLLWIAVRAGLKEIGQALFPWSPVRKASQRFYRALNTVPSEAAAQATTLEADKQASAPKRKGVSSMAIKLSPTQQKELEQLVGLLPCGNIFVLWAGTGLGKSTMLQELHRRLGGALLTMRDFVDAQRQRHPMSLEETFEQLLMDALAQNDIVLVDDLNLIDGVVGCYRYFYPRCGMLNVALNAVCTYAIEANKKLVFTHTHSAPSPVSERCYYFGFNQFEIADYRFFCAAYLGEAAALRLDFEKIYRFAPKLNAHQIKSACQVLKYRDSLDTEQFINYLLEHRLASNVALSEVEQVDIKDLKGIDHVLQALETHVILPFEHDELSKELNLQPKKGVLLYGPPGTGKTTIGRALAHRLKGKFFLIDGTFITGTQDFYERIHHVFEGAKQNAPSIIFIDDSDVIWESQEEMGLYRYLLTQLDGLENEAPGMVCVMMTAMDVGKLPPALVRSGRMELWLELPLPDEQARREILEHWIARLTKPLQDVDVARLVKETNGFTGADLRRLAEDAKNLYAYDRAQRKPLLSPTEYFLMAAEAVRENQQKKADAEAKLQFQHRRMPPFPFPFVPPPMGGDWEAS